jgi:vacuolar-type H+-ATPase subunit D/Vma8
MSVTSEKAGRRTSRRSVKLPVDRLGAGKNRMTDKTDVTNSRFRKRYRELSAAELKLNDAIKNAAAQLEFLYDALGSARHTSIALTELESSVHWGIKQLTGAPVRNLKSGEPITDAEVAKLLRRAKRVTAD